MSLGAEKDLIMNQSNELSAVKTGTTRKPKSKRSRRVFTADYKLAVLAEYDRCTDQSEKERCFDVTACIRRCHRLATPTPRRINRGDPWPLRGR